MNYPWHLYLMAIIYVFAGIFHFIKPKLYLRIMPEYLPKRKFLVYLSGLFEIVLGVSVCIPYLKNTSIVSIICMLLIFLLVHVNMLTNSKSSLGIPKWILILRFPIQFGLIYWAYIYFKL